MGSYISQLFTEEISSTTITTVDVDTTNRKRPSITLNATTTSILHPSYPVRRTSCTIELSINEQGTCDSIQITQQQQQQQPQTLGETNTLPPLGDTSLNTFTYVGRRKPIEVFSDQTMEELRTYLAQYQFPIKDDFNNTTCSSSDSDALSSRSSVSSLSDLYTNPTTQEYDLEMFCGTQQNYC